jgi:hypothetical protein
MNGITLTVRAADGVVLWRSRVAAVPSDGDPILIPDDADDLRAYTLEQRCWVIEGGIVSVSFVARPFCQK